MTDLGKELIFEVEDEGPGIPPELQNRIFEKNVSSKSKNNRGLGLYLVASLVDQLDGQITLESDTGAGSRFILYLPKTLPYPTSDK